MKDKSMVISTKIKDSLNVLLGIIGLEISTTRLRIAREKFIRELERRTHWDTPKYTAGYIFEDANYLQLINEMKSKYADEYNQFHLQHSSELLPTDYFLQNGYFESIDAHLAYGLIRDYQPNAIVEVGSGYSTKVMRLATKANNVPSRLISIDPKPRTDIFDLVDENIASKVELFDPDYIINNIAQGDILFIDSSHTVSMGSDVVFLFLEVLPHLKSGTLVHIHDIFIPYDYPKQFIPYMWNEQYMLNAFLYLNPTFEIVWPSYYMWMKYRKVLVELFANVELCQPPSSLWLRKR